MDGAHGGAGAWSGWAEHHSAKWMARMVDGAHGEWVVCCSAKVDGHSAEVRSAAVSTQQARSHLSTAHGTAGKRMSMLMGRSCRRSRSTDICRGEGGAGQI